MDKPLQTPFQATLLKIHAVWTKVEDVLFYLPRKVVRSFDSTEAFVERGRPSLKVVK